MKIHGRQRKSTPQAVYVILLEVVQILNWRLHVHVCVCVPVCVRVCVLTVSMCAFGMRYALWIKLDDRYK